MTFNVLRSFVLGKMLNKGSLNYTWIMIYICVKVYKLMKLNNEGGKLFLLQLFVVGHF